MLGKKIRTLVTAIAAAAAMALAVPAVLPKTAVTAEAATYATWSVKVQTGYLALRNAKAYNSANEIGKLYTGDTVQVTDNSDSQYWYVFAPGLNAFGYVNKDYLVQTTETADLYETNVNTFLSLRESNTSTSREITRLADGVVVEVLATTNTGYWQVYVPYLRSNGYVYAQYLVDVPGTAQVTSGAVPVNGTTMQVKVATGYLALRTAKAYDSANEIGKLYTGDTVQVTDTSDSTYWYVYSSKLNKSGYVNKNYLVATTQTGVTTGGQKTVRVDSGYLALRKAKAYAYENEIGKLYTGDTVIVTDSSDSKYWFVYVPRLGMNGYVNKNYLY